MNALNGMQCTKPGWRMRPFELELKLRRQKPSRGLPIKISLLGHLDLSQNLPKSSPCKAAQSTSRQQEEHQGGGVRGGVLAAPSAGLGF